MLHSGCGPLKQKLPSPTTETTGWSGRASLTPNAAAMPQPRMFGLVREILLVVAAERHQRVHGLAGVDVADVAGVAVERGLELEPDALEG